MWIVMGRKMSFIEVREAVRRTLVDITSISYCCELSVGREIMDMTEFKTETKSGGN